MDRPEIDPRLFRHVMSRFPTGVTVITVWDGEAPHGMTANAFMSGSLEPPLCVVSVAKRAHMHRFLQAAGAFGVNILADGQGDLSDHFAGRAGTEPAIDFDRLPAAPLLRDVCARIAADVVAQHDCGDHTLFIGLITRMDASDRPPLVYHAGQYGHVIHRRDDREVPLPGFW